MQATLGWRRALGGLAGMLLAGIAAAPAAAARRATLADVHADPHFAAWVAAQAAQAEAAALAGAGACGTRDELRDEELRKNATREALLASLERRGAVPAPAPAGAAAWPWSGTVADTPSFTVVDSGDVSILVDRGFIVYTNRYGQPEVDPVRAARAFYSAHHDEYDFLVVLTNFYSQLAGGSFLAYHMAVANDVLGIGYRHVRRNEVFSDVIAFTRKPQAGRLQSFIHMSDIEAYPDDPTQLFWRQNSSRSLLTHEVGHRWLARVRLQLLGEPDPTILLGRQLTHWQFFFHSHGSALEGNAWAEDGARFSTLDVVLGYGPLDLYLMGMLAPEERVLGQTWYISGWRDLDPPVDDNGNPWGWGSAPAPGVSCAGDRRDFTVHDVVFANGQRLPAYPQAPRDFRVAFALIARDLATVTPQQLARLRALQASFRDYFRAQTLGRGSIDDHIRRVPARMVFVHRPHGDVEDAARPIPVSARIELEPWSEPTRIEDVRVHMRYSVDGGAVTELPMPATGPGDFAADIPPQPLGSTLRYFMVATSNFPDHVSRWPEDGTFEFRVRADGQPPSIQHLPRRAWSRLAEPPLLRALVRDAHGVAAVEAEYRLQGETALARLPLIVQGLSDVYEARLPLPGRIGQVVEYRIVARDVAAAANTAASPAIGFHTILLERELGEGAEEDDPDWTHRSLIFEGLDQWHREIVNPRSGLYAWKIGPKNNVVPGVIAPNQDAVLESPVFRAFPGGSVRFWHRYAFLLHEFNPRLEAIDGGAIEWQDVDRDGPINRWYMLDPDSGYTHWITTPSDASLLWRPVFAGYEPFWRQETCSFSLQPWVTNRTIRVRFRVATSSPQHRRQALDGWYIDDIVIDPGPPPTAVVLEDVRAERTPGGVRVSWRARQAEAGDEFRIDRAATGAPWAALATLRAEPGRDDYEYLDAAPEPGAATYRLALLNTGRLLAEQVTGVPAAYRLALHANVPNPFNPATRVRFEIPAAGPVRLAVYDVRGRHVRDLWRGMLAAGEHAAIWDGRDARGRDAASGLYFYRLVHAGRSETRRMLLVR